MRLRQDWEGPWRWLLGVGVVSLVVGVSGSAVKTTGLEIEQLDSPLARVGLFVLGLCLALVSLIDTNKAEAARPAAAAIAAGADSPDRQVETQRDRIAQLQKLFGFQGAAVDGRWGSDTELACLEHMVGSRRRVAHSMSRRLRGNQDGGLVAWVQRQLNRRYAAGLDVDGVPGGATHDAIVTLLGERDGVVGPQAFRKLTRD